jgi:hypothetical protein
MTCENIAECSNAEMKRITAHIVNKNPTIDGFTAHLAADHYASKNG